MVDISKAFRDKGLRSYPDDSAEVLVPLAAASEGEGAEQRTDVSLKEWFRLPIDERAPVRSVALVELYGDEFEAVVMDTDGGRERWRIVAPARELAMLSAGMGCLDGDEFSERLTMTVITPTTRDPVKAAVIKTPPPPPGPPGDWPLRREIARLLQRTMFTQRVQIISPDHHLREAMLLRLGSNRRR